MSDADAARALASSEQVAITVARMASDVAAIKSDVDQMMQPLVDSLKRNRYFDEMQSQLRKAEKVAQAWRDWPLIIGIHEAVISLRQRDSADRYLLEHLQNLLFEAGVNEYGLEGENIEPDEAEIIAFVGTGAVLTVSACKRPGLKVGSLPLRKPIVEVARSERTV